MTLSRDWTIRAHALIRFVAAPADGFILTRDVARFWLYDDQATPIALHELAEGEALVLDLTGRRGAVRLQVLAGTIGIACQTFGHTEHNASAGETVTLTAVFDAPREPLAGFKVAPVDLAEIGRLAGERIEASVRAGLEGVKPGHYGTTEQRTRLVATLNQLQIDLDAERRARLTSEPGA